MQRSFLLYLQSSRSFQLSCTTASEASICSQLAPSLLHVRQSSLVDLSSNMSIYNTINGNICTCPICIFSPYLECLQSFPSKISLPPETNACPSSHPLRRAGGPPKKSTFYSDIQFLLHNSRHIRTFIYASPTYWFSNWFPGGSCFNHQVTVHGYQKQISHIPSKLSQITRRCGISVVLNETLLYIRSNFIEASGSNPCLFSMVSDGLCCILLNISSVHLLANFLLTSQPNESSGSLSIVEQLQHFLEGN